MNKVKKVDDHAIIKQSNRLVEARYKLTLNEQKMIVAICSQLGKNATEFATVRIKVADMADFCGFTAKDRYTVVKDVIMRLLDRKLMIHYDNGGWYGTHWLQSARYIPEESIIEYRVDDNLKPELLQLKKAYLQTPALPMMTMSRDYSIRIYMLLKKMLKLQTFEYEIKTIREMFCLGKTYEKISNFKNKIMEPALKEINDKSDIKVTHEYIKVGRTYTKIQFTVTQKEKSYEEGAEELGQIPLPLEAPKNSKKKKKELDEDQKSVLKNLIDRGVSAEQAERIVRRYSVARIRRNIALAVKQKDTARNPGGLIVTFIRDDTAGQNKKAKIELEKEKIVKAKDKKQAKEFFHGKQKPMTDSKGNMIQYDEPVRLKLN